MRHAPGASAPTENGTPLVLNKVASRLGEGSELASWQPLVLSGQPGQGAAGNGKRGLKAGENHAGRSGKIRFATFSFVGAAVFALGLGIQVFLVSYVHLGTLLSYIIQGLVSVQVSFLLNRFLTWRGVKVSFWKALLKFNVQKIATTIANTLVYQSLVSAGLNYIASNVAVTAIFTVVNFLSADNWVFVPDENPSGSPGRLLPPPRKTFWDPATCPSASIVVPCKNSQRTIRATALSLLGQDYPGLQAVVLVGSTGDMTWQALEGITDPRLVILESPPGPGRRDPNVKRARGAEHTRTDIVAMADSDIVMDPSWLSRGIALIGESGKHCVAGGMRSIRSDFWGRFVDSTTMGAKTPRVCDTYVVTSDNFGRRRKPPVTANVILTRKSYEACPPDASWSFGYEDYEWFWRMTRSGYSILFSHEMTGRHHHRQGLAPLCREYLQASDGCARFIDRHPDCPLAVKRRRQAFLLPIAALVAAVAGVASIAGGFGSLVGALASIGLVVAVMREYVNSRDPESLLYLPINFVLGLTFWYGLVRGLATHRAAGSVFPVPAYFGQTHVRRSGLSPSSDWRLLTASASSPAFPETAQRPGAAADRI
jgi:putative flippase GtrA